MAATKKVFFGSLFSFTSTGANDFIEDFRTHFNEPEDAPFISYDENNSLFSCDVDVHDKEIVPLFGVQIHTYITMRSRDASEPWESEKLTPIEGTIFRDDILNHLPREQNMNALLDVEDSSNDEDSSVEDGSVMYWMPQSGDISILARDVASEIADSTGCHMIPDKVAKRIKLAHGNPQLALEKMQRLEGVLAYGAPHHLELTSRLDNNVLLLQTGPGSTIKFLRPNSPHCGFGRIVLSLPQNPFFNKILVGEVRLWENSQRVTPRNLDLEEVELTAVQSTSKLFADVALPKFGDVKNAEARAPSNESSQVSGSIQRPGSPTKFLGQKDAERVEEWRGQVDPKAAPTLPPAEPASDEGKGKGMSRRRMAVDSDDEEEAKENVVDKSLDTTESFNQTDHGDGSEKCSDQPPSVRYPIDEPRSSKRQSTSNNMFALIADGGDADRELSESEDDDNHVIANYSIKPKQNVKFAELQVSHEELPSPQKAQNPTPTTFDPSKYGVKKHISPTRSDTASKQYSSPSYGKKKTKASGPPSVTTQSMRRSDAPHLPLYRQQQFGGQGHYRNTSQAPPAHRHRQQQLIDVTFEEAGPAESIQPPPGFEYRSSSSVMPTSPLVTPQPKAPSGRPAGDLSARANVSTASTTQPWEAQNVDNDYKPQLTVPKRNVKYLQDQAVARIKAQIEASKASKSNARDDKDTLPQNRIQQDDEYSSRKYHDTMSQRMAKPSKGPKKGGKQESKAEKDARIAKAKAEAYGDTSDAKNPAATGKGLPKTQRLEPAENMSARKRQLIKQNQTMADLHQDDLRNIATEDAATKVADALRPILEATRAYKGVIKVEAQLGQALILKDNHFDENPLYTPKEWEQLLNSNLPNRTGAIFTNILTMNGLDVDRMLEIKADIGSMKLWDKNHPGLATTIFEFTCQDKSGLEFLLNLDQDGNHTLTKLPATIGKVGLHMPSQIWDACVIVSGCMKILRPSEELLTGVKQFLETLYIPGGRRAEVYFRLPGNSAFAIKAIIVKRISVHDCQLPDRSDIQLRITESKVLAHFSNLVDKKLFRSYEVSYPVMAQESRIHYEVAIVNKSVEEAYVNNPDIEIGELADINTPDGKIMGLNQAKSLVDVTAYMLTRIDWAGASNIGTLRRITDNEADKRASIINTLPPALNHNLPVPVDTAATTVVAPTTYPSQYSRASPKKGSSGSGGAGNTNNYDIIPQPLPGVRANTTAQMYRDPETGDMYYFGQGGARIPVVHEQPEGMRFGGMGPVVPGDSASQVGDSSKKRTPAPAGGKNRAGAWDDKPPGFW